MDIKNLRKFDEKLQNGIFELTKKASIDFGHNFDYREEVISSKLVELEKFSPQKAIEIAEKGENILLLMKLIRQPRIKKYFDALSAEKIISEIPKSYRDDSFGSYVSNREDVQEYLQNLTLRKALNKAIKIKSYYIWNIVLNRKDISVDKAVSLALNSDFNEFSNFLLGREDVKGKIKEMNPRKIIDRALELDCFLLWKILSDCKNIKTYILRLSPNKAINLLIASENGLKYQDLIFDREDVQKYVRKIHYFSAKRMGLFFNDYHIWKIILSRRDFWSNTYTDYHLDYEFGEIKSWQFWSAVVENENFSLERALKIAEDIQGFNVWHKVLLRSDMVFERALYKVIDLKNDDFMMYLLEREDLTVNRLLKIAEYTRGEKSAVWKKILERKDFQKYFNNLEYDKRIVLAAKFGSEILWKKILKEVESI